MVIRSLVIGCLIGLASLSATLAHAEDKRPEALAGISFADPSAEFSGFRIDFGPRPEFRFSSGPTRAWAREEPDAARSYEIALSADDWRGLPVDVSVAQRASFAADSAGDIARQGRGSELRLGRGLAMRRRNETRSGPAIYAFVAADDEALTWQPGVRSAFGGQSASFALQDRVEIGDVQIGVTYERAGLQASLAYVEREVSVQTMGNRSVSQDENFAGFTLTMRR